MVGRPLLRVRPSRDICIFCACRLRAVPPSTSAPSLTRAFWNDPWSSQSTNSDAPPKWAVDATTSSLTKAEQAERDRLRQLRESRELEQLQHVKTASATRPSSGSISRPTKTRSGAHEAQPNQQQGRSGSNRQIQGGVSAGAKQRQSDGNGGNLMQRSRAPEQHAPGPRITSIPTRSVDPPAVNRLAPKTITFNGVLPARSTNPAVTERPHSAPPIRSIPSSDVIPPSQPATSPTPFLNVTPNTPSPLSNKLRTTSAFSKGPSPWNLSETFTVEAPPPPPPPPKVQTASKKNKGSGYTTLDYDPKQHRSREGTPGDTESTWEHLPTRRPASTPTTNKADTASLYVGSDEWVDRAFERHRQEREVSSRKTTSKPIAAQNHQAASVGNEARTCARCGEKGHIARECMLHIQCNRCGENGHKSSDCPQKTKDRGERESRPREDEIPVGPEFGRVAMNKSDADSKRSRRARKFVDEEEPTTDHRRTSRSLRFEEEDVDDRGVDRKKKRSRRREVEEDDDNEDDVAARREAKNAEKAARQAQRREERANRELKRRDDAEPVALSSFMTVAQLAQALGVKYESFINTLDRLGYDDVFPGMVLNADVSGMIAMEYNFDPIFEDGELEAENRDLQAQPKIEDTALLPARPPVVTIMGHVDHGKTTILDYLRKSSIVAGEAGGITQHIGAFSVPLAASGKTITFLDTPGHAAFLAMRQRGADVTDIVVLVVAADDSVKPQTLEAIKHAKGAGVPIIVAVNKIDKEEADLQRVKNDLARHDIDIEDFGGETQVVPVSGKTGQGMDELEESIVTLSEILDHRAPTDGPVEGWVLEAKTVKSGRVATVLVRRGTLKTGTILVAGQTWTRVRTLRDESGRPVEHVGPGMPVEVDGWRDQPLAGDEVLEAPSEQKASDVVDYREELAEKTRIAADIVAINNLRRAEQEKRAQAAEADPDAEAAPRPRDTTSGHQSVPFIIKADVSGSAEAVSSYIMSISSPMISPHVLDAGVGQVFESDVDLAATSGSCIISFNLPLDENIRALAAAKGVKILENNIIYRVLEEVKTELEDRLPPIVTHRVLGEAEISVPFEIGVGGRKKLKIAGCKVRNGMIGRNARARVLRNEEKVFDGTLSSLKNVKKDVQEMRKGTECGMSFAGWEDFEVGDLVQTYEEISERRTL